MKRLIALLTRRKTHKPAKPKWDPIFEQPGSFIAIFPPPEEPPKASRYDSQFLTFLTEPVDRNIH